MWNVDRGLTNTARQNKLATKTTKSMSGAISSVRVTTRPAWWMTHMVTYRKQSSLSSVYSTCCWRVCTMHTRRLEAGPCVRTHTDTHLMHRVDICANTSREHTCVRSSFAYTRVCIDIVCCSMCDCLFGV